MVVVVTRSQLYLMMFKWIQSQSAAGANEVVRDHVGTDKHVQIRDTSCTPL